MTPMPHDCNDQHELGEHDAEIRNLSTRVGRIEDKLDTALAYIHSQQGRRTVITAIVSAAISGVVSWLVAKFGG